MLLLRILFIAAIGLFVSCNSSGKVSVKKPASTVLPEFLKGTFLDDYGVVYSIDDTLWQQQEIANYHIIRHNEKEQYIIARNDSANRTSKNLYTRIDYMRFENMDPWYWGYCFSVYNAANDSIAANSYVADRENPRKGCNGFPFSRMKRK